jgi:hypothetical protein
MSDTATKTDEQKQFDQLKVEEMLSQIRMPRTNGLPTFFSWGSPELMGEKTIVYGTDKLSLYNSKGPSIERKCEIFIRFKVKGLLFNGLVYVLLDWDDTYRILLVKSSNRRPKGSFETVIKNTVVEEMSMIYYDQLAEIIDHLVERKR